MCSYYCTAEGEEAPPPGGWTDVQDADLPTAMAQQVADIVSIVKRKCRLRLGVPRVQDLVRLCNSPY